MWVAGWKIVNAGMGLWSGSEMWVGTGSEAVPMEKDI